MNVRGQKFNLGTTKVMTKARERRNSRATATIMENQVIKRPIVEKNTLRIKNLSIRITMLAAPM